MENWSLKEKEEDEQTASQEPGFVFLGLASEGLGLRWCKHIAVDTLLLRRLVIQTGELWPLDASNRASEREYSNGDSIETPSDPTRSILERLEPLCTEETMLQLRLEGELTRQQYHQLDLNQIRRYGEEHCFALAIDDSGITLLSDQDSMSISTGALTLSKEQVLEGPGGLGGKGIDAPVVNRFSPREELMALADEWITAASAASDEREKKALLATKEELLAVLDEAPRRTTGIRRL